VFFLYIYEYGTLKPVEIILRRGVGTARRQWLMPVILATERQRSGISQLKASSGK
jgi:hypothetical protein